MIDQNTHPGDRDVWSIGSPENPRPEDPICGSEEAARKNAETRCAEHGSDYAVYRLVGVMRKSAVAWDEAAPVPSAPVADESFKVGERVEALWTARIQSHNQSATDGEWRLAKMVGESSRITDGFDVKFDDGTISPMYRSQVRRPAAAPASALFERGNLVECGTDTSGKDHDACDGTIVAVGSGNFLVWTRDDRETHWFSPGYLKHI